jgi:hypothetical protein
MLPALMGCASADRTPETSSTPETPHATELAVRVSDRRLVLTNPDTSFAYYHVFDESVDAVIKWRPCEVPHECPEVAPRATREVPYDSIFGYRPESKEMVLYWWRLRAQPDGTLQPDSVRSQRLPF